MLQRGLAILLSVCMLVGGTGDTVYAMSPQTNAGLANAAQTVSDTGEISEFSTEDATGDPAAEDERKSEEDQAENGTENGSEIGDEEGDASGSEATDDDNAGDNTAEDNADSASDADQSGTEDDDNTTEAEDGNDSDAAVREDEAVAEDQPEGETEDEVDEPEVAVSVQSIREEVLSLMTGVPQEVTLAEEEKQWLYFTAPQEGLFRFYSTSESSSYQYKEVYLFHEKTNSEYSYFDSDWGSGENGNFSCTYRMQAGETVYLLVCYGVSAESGTFKVNAEEVEVPELKVTKNDEGDYTLRSDAYQLSLLMTPSYSSVTAKMELRKADGSALTGSSSYRIYYQCSYDYYEGGTSSTSNTIYLDSYSGYQGETTISKAIAAGGELLFTELQIRDSNGNILAALGTGGQVISVHMIATEKQGILTSVTAEDTYITVEAEMVSNHNGRLRYRKKEEIEWSYCKDIVYYYYYSSEMTIPAEPDTDYVVELTAMDIETVYDTAEIRTKAFAASEINAEVTDVTSSSATIKVTVGKYTWNKNEHINQYFRGRVSYTDSMGDLRTSTGGIELFNYPFSFNLKLDNLAAGTEYTDLVVELDDTDSTSMEYVAYRIEVPSFTTVASTLTAEQINVTATPDAEDGTKAVLNVALKNVTAGSYPYTVKYRVAGSKDWKNSVTKTGTLSSGSYTDELVLTSLVGDTEYEVLVMVDGISSEVTSFKTVAAAVAAVVEVKPLMQGVQVTAALTPTETLSGTYTISVHHYDQDTHRWNSVDATGYNDKRLTSNNNWESTAVCYSNNIRPNAINDWKISISSGSSSTVYEKYFSLQAVSQEVSLTAENIMCTTAQIKAVLAARDESIRNNTADLYYRAKGAKQWISGESCSYSYENGDTIYLDGLKEDTQYEVKLVPSAYPDDILAQTTFRTLKDTRSVSVSVDSCRYTSAQVNWTFDAGANVLPSSSHVCVYYREKGDATWDLLDSTWRNTTYTEKTFLKDLEAGTSYEVLVELKDDYSTIAGQHVVRDVKTEFTTLAIDHELKAEPVTDETDATSVSFDMQLSKKTGELANRAKVEITLEFADGSLQSKTVYLNKDNQYKAKLKVSDLLPNTKYTVSAALYESENNEWIWLKDFNLGEVTTAEAKAPTELTISETEFALNKGTSKKLTVTTKPQEAAVGLTWVSSDETVARVFGDGTVVALSAGKADITVSAASASDGDSEKVSAVSHVTVRDYEIRVKNTDGYGNIPSILSKTQERILVVYDNTEEKDLAGVVWSSSNPNAARISDAGLLKPQNYGQSIITAKTEEGIILQDSIKVVNEIQGFSITRPETDNDSYQAIRTAEAVYQVAAGETYRVGCVLSPAYTDQYDSTVSMSGDRFIWSADNSAVTIEAYSYGTEITIPESVSEPVKVSAVMKDEEYKDKSFTITLDVLKKPEVEWLPDTYTWLDYSNKLKDVVLPENWQWKEQNTLIYEAGWKTFTARYAEFGYYPYETEVDVYAEKMGNSLSVPNGNYSAAKKAYVVKKETPLKVRMDALGGSIPALLYEQSALAPAAKDAAKVSVTAPDETGYYSVTASAKGIYTVSAAVSLKKAAFEKKNGEYVLTAGDIVKSTTASVKFMAVDSAPIKNITFAVAADSPEKVTLTEDGTIEYEITAVNADTKNNQRVIYLDVTAQDIDGNKVENPNINYAVSDAAVVKLKKEGTGRLVLTIPKGADGLAKIVATAKDDLGYSTQFAVRVKDYTPRVTTSKVTINENYTYSKELAQVVLPYLEENDDWLNEPSLVETNSQGGKDKVAGLKVTATSMSGGYQYRIWLRVEDKEKIKKKGNLKYYLAIASNAYRGTEFVPVQIKIETGLPTVSLKQSNKVNVFYTDTTHLSSYDYDAVSMGLVDVSSTASIESVRWVAGDGNEAAANTEFVIERAYTSTSKNGKYTRKYMIQQHNPTLNTGKKPLDAAAKGNLYVRLSGYQDEVKLPFTIQTVYKKPKLKVADYKVCPALEEMTDSQYVYTNAAKTNNNLVSGWFSLVWRGYSDVLCADEEIQVVDNYSTVGLRYNGTKDKKTQLTFYSDYWYEALTVPVKVKVAKSQVKLSPATVTLNTAYPSETTRTTATTKFYNAATGAYVGTDDVKIEGANAKAQELLDNSLLNLNLEYDASGSYMEISVNYANAMGRNQIKPGSYKFRLIPYREDTALNSVTLTVKIINKEATVKVKAKGTIDLLKLNWNGNDYDYNTYNSVTVTPTFKNVDSSYYVTDAELEGAYKDLFRISRYSDGSLKIIPRSLWSLKAGKSYQLSVTYTVEDVNGRGGETITVTSNTFTIKPKQSAPKVTASAKQLVLYACAKGEAKAETMYLYVPHSDYKKGYYVIEDAGGSLDVNKDGKADLIVKTSSIDKSSGRAQIAVYVLDADAVKATANGVAYKIPVTVKCVGRDGVSKDAATTVSVVVKK